MDAWRQDQVDIARRNIANGIPDSRRCGDPDCDLNGVEHRHFLSTRQHPVAPEKRKPDWLFRAIIGFVVAVIAFGIFGCFMSVRQSTHFWDACVAAGGHVVDVGKGRICVSEDGGVIEP